MPDPGPVEARGAQVFVVEPFGHGAFLAFETGWIAVALHFQLI